MLIDFKDHVVIGAVSGALGLLTRDIYSFFAKLIGFAKHEVWIITADLFLKGKPSATFLGHLIGLLGDIAMGSLFGVVFVYFLKYTNMKNIIWKGWGFGLAVWLLIFGIMLHSMPQTTGTAPDDALSNLSAFFGHSIFGIGMGVYAQILLKKFGLLEEGWNRQKTRG